MGFPLRWAILTVPNPLFQDTHSIPILNPPSHPIYGFATSPANDSPLTYHPLPAPQHQYHWVSMDPLLVTIMRARRSNEDGVRGHGAEMFLVFRSENKHLDVIKGASQHEAGPDGVCWRVQEKDTHGKRC